MGAVMEATDHQVQGQLGVSIQIPADQLGLDSSDERTFELNFSSAETFFAVYEILQVFDIDKTTKLVFFGHGLLQVLNQAVENGDLPGWKVAWDAIWRHLHQMMVVPQNVTNTPEDRALWVTYRLLHSNEITHKQAADIASRLLNKEFKEDTWRIRVARWAKDHGLPRVGKRTPKSKKQNRTNTPNPNMT